MGLASALTTSVNGLALNETTIDVIGNNIANAGTIGFKASRVLFTTQLSRTLSVGSRPDGDNGGTNPRQIGLGAITSAISKEFTQGGITNSTSPSDLAIQGEGFFVLSGSEGNVYTRNGSFSLNSESELVNDAGLKVQGYGVDGNFSLVTTTLSDISIPLGDLQIASQTQNAVLGGALLSTGDTATQGSLLTSEALTDSTTSAAITTASLLVNVQNGSSVNLFTSGETLSFSPKEGGRSVAAETLAVTGTTTVADWIAFMDNVLGLHSGGTIPNDANSGGQPGVTVTAGGEIQVVGNTGEVNDIEIVVGDLTSNGVSVPLTFTKSQTANGESAITDFVVFDSLGDQITLKMTMALESKSTTSTTFRWFIDTPDDSGADNAIANGTIVFDGLGNISATNSTSTFSLNRDNTAAVSPMQVTLDFSGMSGISTTSAGSGVKLVSQDGSSAGTLSSFVIDETGVINGVFDNGIIRTLGQITMARFANPQGLFENGGGTYRENVSSGTPFITTPGNFGVGTIQAGAIELSNTDIGRNLVDLIVASTNYRGNARVISSVQQLVDELLVLGR